MLDDIRVIEQIKTAEGIYRQDPAMLLYAPLRSLIYIDCGDVSPSSSPARYSPALPIPSSPNSASTSSAH